MGEEISDELKAKARDEAIKRMLKAWEDKPEEKGASWGPIFGHVGTYGEFIIREIKVSVDGSSTMAVIVLAKGGGLDEILQLPPGESIIFRSNSSAVKKIDLKGVGTEDQYAFGKWGYIWS